MLYYEDIELNKVMVSDERYIFSGDDIMSFARKYDPMPFHLDRAIAEAGIMGKLFASSIHTIAIAFKLTHSISKDDAAIIAGLGWQDVKFPHPVFEGDRIYVESEFIEKRVSASQPDKGIIVNEIRVLNQNDVLVTSFKVSNLIMLRGR